MARPGGSDVTRSIPTEENLTVEFKSDQKTLSDSDLVAAVVALANTEGGELYLGVEDDGTITGAQPQHHDVGRLAALISARTVPPISVRANVIDEQGHRVVRVEVPKSSRIVSTSQGLVQRRRLNAHGKPEAVPFHPHEFAGRLADLGLIDYSAQPLPNASLADLDPLERERIRRCIQTRNGDKALLELPDDELDGALGLVVRNGNGPIPTVAGLLLVGKEESLRRLLPAHEVAFQVLENTDVRVNDFYHWPLLRVFERVEEQFGARVTEQEIQIGLFRVPVPNVDRSAFREAVINAVTHRDYTSLGAVHVQWQTHELMISNPGGFVAGVTIENLLVVPPKPRNPLLADAFKRLGLAERTGRGVDKIFAGLLRYGRPPPSYSSTTGHTVVVRLSCSEADLAFLRMVVEAESRSGVSLPVASLLALSVVRTEGRAKLEDVTRALQNNEDTARRVLSTLVETGLLEAHGQTRGRFYTLSSKVYGSLGAKVGYARQVGLDAVAREQAVLQAARRIGPIRRTDVVELCKIDPRQATRLLSKLVQRGDLVIKGTRKSSTYEIAGKNMTAVNPSASTGQKLGQKRSKASSPRKRRS
jgi:ATP-dependent DNA helicase RecG